jgi:hypothetical protein
MGELLRAAGERFLEPPLRSWEFGRNAGTMHA